MVILMILCFLISYIYLGKKFKFKGTEGSIERFIFSFFLGAILAAIVGSFLGIAQKGGGGSMDEPIICWEPRGKFEC